MTEAAPYESAPTWERLHPATIVELIVRQTAQLIVAIVLLVGGGGGGFDAIIGLVVFGPAVATYLTSRYRVDPDRVYYQRGVFRRQATELPRGQIQSVETTINIFGRVFGLETLTISTAGGGDSEIRLGLLSTDAAARLRHQLTPVNSTVPPPSAPVESAATTPDIGSPSAADASQAAIAAAVTPVPETVIASLSSGDWFQVLRSRPGIGGLVLANQSFELQATRFGDRIRTRRGLFQVRTQEAPVDRVQGVLAHQTVVSRSQGVEQLVVDTADASGAGASTSILVHPIAPVGRWMSLAHELLGAEIGDLRGVAPAALRRLRTRAIIDSLPLVLVAPIVAVATDAPQAAIAALATLPLLSLAARLAVARLRFLRHRYGVNTGEGAQRHLTVQTGALWTSSLVLSTDTIQSVTVSSTWFQRRLDLATVTADPTTRTLSSAIVSDITRADAGRLAGRLL